MGYASAHLYDVAVRVAGEGHPDTKYHGGDARRGVADRSLEAGGIEQGMTIEVGPQRTPIEVVGWIDGLVYSGQGSLYAQPATWRDVLNQNRPTGPLPGPQPTTTGPRW